MFPDEQKEGTMDANDNVMLESCSKGVSTRGEK
jgi:hypothetical protein